METCVEEKCSRHSGFEERMNAHVNILKSFDQRFVKIDDRLYHILIGIVLCLISSLFTMVIAIWSSLQKQMDIREGYHAMQDAFNVVDLVLRWSF